MSRPPATDPRLERLMLAAELSQEREVAALAALRRRIAALEAAFAAAGTDPVDGLLEDGFAQSGGLRRWRLLARQRRIAINLELGRLRAELPGQEAAARRALGRCLALERLRARQAAAARSARRG